jgi:hypothetical protein
VVVNITISAEEVTQIQMHLEDDYEYYYTRILKQAFTECLPLYIANVRNFLLYCPYIYMCVCVCEFLLMRRCPIQEVIPDVNTPQCFIIKYEMEEAKGYNTW